MGNYTELALACELNESLQAGNPIVRTLESMVRGEGVCYCQHHPLFDTHRWWWMLTSSGSYYFPSISDPRFVYDEISKSWKLSFRTNINNYDREWEEFLDWLGPFVRRGDGLYRYEESVLPTTVAHHDRKFHLIEHTAEEKARFSARYL